MKLEKFNKNKLDLENFKKEFLEEKKRKKGKIIKEILNENDNMSWKDSEEENSEHNDPDIDIFNNPSKANKIKKIDFDSDEEESRDSMTSDWGNSLDESFEDFSDDEISQKGIKKKKKKGNKSFEINLNGVILFYS